MRKSKYLQIFNYLKEFSKLRSKPVRDIDAQETQYPEKFWLNDIPENELLDAELSTIRKRKIANANPFGLPNRMWIFLLSKVQINPDSLWLDLSKKNRNKLINILLNDTYEVSGKTTFKEEFVTCGGVDLADIDFKTMQSRVCTDIYFCGEVMNVDGITGGFNFQAAWTTGFIAGRLE